MSREQAQGTHPNASESREAPFGPQESPTAPAYCLAITKCVGGILRVGLLVFHGKAKALREHLSLQGQEASNAPAKKLPSAQQVPRTESDPNPVVVAPWLDPKETYGD